MTTFPQVSVTAIANGSEVGGIPAVFRFSRTGPTTEALSVNYRLRGTAQPTVDYDGYFSGTIDFSQGASTADLRLAGRADTPTALGSAYTLLAADITNGFAEVPTGTLSNGTTYSFNAKVIDNAGNESSASTNFITTVDTTAPGDTTSPTITGISVTGNQVLLQFSEALDLITLPTAARFTARVADVIRTISAIAPVASNPTLLQLTLSVTPTSAQSVTVTYTDLTAGNDPNGIVQDLAGNDMASVPAPLNADSFSTASTVATLAANYTNLFLLGTASAKGTGNALNNTITGNRAANVITGHASQYPDGPSSWFVQAHASSTGRRSMQLTTPPTMKPLAAARAAASPATSPQTSAPSECSARTWAGMRTARSTPCSVQTTKKQRPQHPPHRGA